MTMPLLVEGALAEVWTLLQARLPGALAEVARHYAGDGFGLNLDPIPIDKYYLSEVIDPLQLPAIFTVVDDTVLPDENQNFLGSVHTMRVSVLLEDPVQGVTNLTRKVYRYGIALVRALHQQSSGSIYVTVKGVRYYPTYTWKTSAGDRHFEKALTLRCEVRQYESFQ